MFVQLIEGHVKDGSTLRAQMKRWMAELRPGATGFLGSTGGITESGKAIMLVRFESAAAAKANSDRPEQGQWWEATARCFDGEVSFSESDDVDALLAGGSNDAGFVQVMKGSFADRERIRGLDARLAELAPTLRPDLIGGVRAWMGRDAYVEFAYFTSEAAAREGEAKEMPAELVDDMAEFGELMAGVEFIDIKDPWLY